MLTKFDICANQNCVIFDKSLGLNEPRVSNELQKRIDSERSEDNRKTRPRGSVCGAGSGIRTHGLPLRSTQESDQTLRYSKPIGLGLRHLDKILEHGWHLKKNGYRESTITSRVKSLRALDRRADLFNPEDVKANIANSQLSEGRKELLSVIYAGFAKQFGLSFTVGRYRRVRKLPFIPLEEEINQLIGGVNRKTAAYLQTIKETGARANEAWCIRWTDIDFERQSASITPEKNSDPRRLRISSKLIGMLNGLPRKNEYVFGGGNLDHFSRWFQLRRRAIAENLANPRIRMISFRTLRHYFGSMTYNRTRDIIFTMRQLGHKNIRNTLVYLDMVQFESSDYVCKIAKTIKEAQELVENGFDYVTAVEGCKLFRKRK